MKNKAVIYATILHTHIFLIKREGWLLIHRAKTERVANGPQNVYVHTVSNPLLQQEHICQ